MPVPEEEKKDFGNIKKFLILPKRHISLEQLLLTARKAGVAVGHK
jgi:hypothetical protein